MQTIFLLFIICRMLIDIACRGTESKSGNQPSPSCCCRHYVLRTVTSELTSPSSRRELYWFASKLYEDHNLLEEAIEALQGRL